MSVRPWSRGQTSARGAAHETKVTCAVSRLSIKRESEAGVCGMHRNELRPQARLRGVWRPRSCVIVALAVPTLLFAGAASAQETSACMVAADKGQDLRDA